MQKKKKKKKKKNDFFAHGLYGISLLPTIAMYHCWRLLSRLKPCKRSRQRDLMLAGRSTSEQISFRKQQIVWNSHLPATLTHVEKVQKVLGSDWPHHKNCSYVHNSHTKNF